MSVVVMSYGEGFHNYHHVFPHDYKAAELGDHIMNPTTAFIDFFARIGWAYSLKTISEETIRKRIARTGDGTHKFFGKNDSTHNTDSINGDGDHHSHGNHVWGWGDEDMKEEDYKSVSIVEDDE
jgi:stearoyl-CoA desaturase (delta-9 desaturase)